MAPALSSVSVPLPCRSFLSSRPVQVYDPAPGSEERVVALTSSEDALSPYCAAQDALVRCVIALTAGAAEGQAAGQANCPHTCSNGYIPA